MAPAFAFTFRKALRYRAPTSCHLVATGSTDAPLVFGVGLGNLEYGAAGVVERHADAHCVVVSFRAAMLAVRIKSRQVKK